jgi:phage terminase large subunit-like protein
VLDLDGQSLSVRLAELTPEEREEILEGIPAKLRERLVRSWLFERRANQIPPIVFFILAIMGGRGSGKTRTATEWVTDRIESGSTWINLLSRTHADVRDTMIQGESGLIEVAHRRGIDAEYEVSKRRLWYPDYKAQALIFGAQIPDESRGSQCETGWADEFSTYPLKTDAAGNTALSNLILTCRLGDDPRLAVSFTPKTRKEVKDLIALGEDETSERVALLKMSLYDNLANLADVFIEATVGLYQGTRLEAQEIFGEYLEAVEGALWTPELLDRQRVDDHPVLDVVEVGVDPPGETAAECGIVVAGVEASGSERKRAFVLADLSIRGPAEVWAKRAIDAYYFYGASAIVAETNQGHDMVRACIHAIDRDVRIRKVNAHESKRARAEPVELLYEAARVFHVGSPAAFLLLEGQMTGWDPNDRSAPSPDRMDALVWVISDLLGLLHRRKGRASSAADMRLPEVGGGTFGNYR